jgi:hypothetical protein
MLLKPQSFIAMHITSAEARVRFIVTGCMGVQAPHY